MTTAAVSARVSPFKAHPEHIRRNFTHAERVENGRKGADKSAVLSAVRRCQAAHLRAVKRVMFGCRLSLDAHDRSIVEALGMALAKSCYERGYTAGRRSRARSHKQNLSAAIGHNAGAVAS